MDDDFEVEFANDQETGSNTPTPETPAVEGDEQDLTSDKSKGEAPAKEASEEGKADPKEEKAAESKLDDDLDEWAEKAGHEKPETDKERKLLQKLRDSQRDFTRDRQAKKGADSIKDVIDTKKSEVKPDASKDEQDPSAKRLAALEEQNREERTLRLRSEFFSQNSISEETSGHMAAILKEMVDKAPSLEEKQAELAYWTNPNKLQAWLDLAKAREASGNGSEQIVDEATRAERERIAKLSKANGPQRAAKQSVQEKQMTELEKLWAD